MAWAKSLYLLRKFSQMIKIIIIGYAVIVKENLPMDSYKFQ